MSSEIASAQSPPPGDEFMRDIDRLVITTLKNAGYPIESEDRRLRNYNFEDIVNMVIFCLRTLFPERNFAESLPFGMQNRYRLSTQLAEAVQSLNYTEEIGYHIFMYSNKESIRNVLIFLSDQLPRTDITSTYHEKENSKRSNIKLKIREELKKMLSKKNKDDHPGMTTIPFISLPLETGVILPAQKIDCKPIEWKEFVVQKLPYIDDQVPDSRCLLPSVVSLNATGIHFPKRMKKSSITLSPLSNDFFKLFSDNSRSADISRLQTLNAIQNKESQPGSDGITKNVIEISETEEAVIETEKKVNQTKPRVEQLKNELKEIKIKTENLQRILKEEQSRQSTLEKSLSLLPSSEANIAKLDDLIVKSKEKIATLEKQTNNHRQVLQEKLEKLQKIEEKKVARKNQLSERISQIRSEVFVIAEQYEQRNALYEQLEKRAKSVQGEDRNVHVQRIFRFIDNLNLQEMEISKIINDIRVIQKQINTESEKADRTFLVASRIVKDNASTDPFAAKIYQSLLTVHKLISDIIQLDAERVNQEREVSQLEYELLIQDNKPSQETFVKIQSDITQLQKEIAEIEIRMKC